MTSEQFREEIEVAVTLLSLPTEESSRNILHSELDLSKTITGKMSARKKPRKTKVPMPEDGICPFPLCDWRCKSLNTSTFSMHCSRKHQFEVGTPLLTYMCGLCNRICDSRSALNTHIKGAHETRKWGCLEPNCSHKATSKGGILDHYMRKHGNIKNDEDCINENRCCIHCGKERTTKGGHMHHLAVCLGFDERAERNKIV